MRKRKLNAKRPDKSKPINKEVLESFCKKAFTFNNKSKQKILRRKNIPCKTCVKNTKCADALAKDYPIVCVLYVKNTSTETTTKMLRKSKKNVKKAVKIRRKQK